MTVPVDKLTSIIFDTSPTEFEELVIGGERAWCVEGTDKKGNEICSSFTLSLIDENKDFFNAELAKKPFTPFQREVFFAACSAYEQNFQVLTFSATLNLLTGGQNKDFHVKQLENVAEAFRKLAFTGISVDLNDVLKAYPNYRKRISTAKITGAILPCKILECEINGKKTVAVKLLDESPLMTIAHMKRQLLTYDVKPLAIPEQRHTETTVSIDNYLLRRVHLIRRGVNSSIRLDTVYRNCGLENVNRKQKFDARKTIDDVLNHFKAEGLIANFTWFKKDGTWHSITITVAKPTKYSK